MRENSVQGKTVLGEETEKRGGGYNRATTVSCWVHSHYDNAARARRIQKTLENGRKGVMGN